MPYRSCLWLSLQQW
uniref:Uncharacterized protein n=1 Tax=Arundo donax TaxID=35708 RepID=A0A0A8ZXK2_ARUDO